MSKTKKLMSILLAAVLAISMLSCFCLTSAATADVDKLIYSPFTALTTNPGYASAVPSSVVYVSSAWKDVGDGSWVYMNYSGDVYKAVKGINAFATISDALEISGADNMKIKVGAGTYIDTGISNGGMLLSYSGVKFYGNYAGVNPNVAGANPYAMDLNPQRDPAMESVIDSSYWKWTTASNNITIDGFKVTGSTIMYIAVSGAYSEYFYFYNNILSACTKTVLDANRGYSTGTYVKYNRFENNTGTLFQGGGSMCDTVMDYNYFQGNTGGLYYFTSCGDNGNETLVSFSYNIVNNCTQGINFGYDNANFGANLDYKRIVGNLFNNSGSSSGYMIRANYVLEYYKSATDKTPSLCNNTGCKTFISDNEFYNIPSGIYAIKLDGGGNLTDRAANFVVSATENKFIYAASAAKRMPILSTIIGTLDASHNFFGTVSTTGTVTKFNPDETTFNINSDTHIITMPYYNDYNMTTLSGGINLQVGSSRILSVAGFEKTGFNIDNTKASMSVVAVKGFETVNFTKVVTGADYEIYTDFLLTNKAVDNKVDILDTLTRVYLVATDALTGMSVKYDVVIQSDTDKTKADIRKIIDLSTMSQLAYYTVSGTDITIDLPSKYLYFPFEIISSPSATCTLYTDEAKTTLYNNPLNYIKPDEQLVLYANVVSGDGSIAQVYRITIDREGSDDHDARIISVISPEADVLVFNNERKSISYRPFAMISSAKFNFRVSTNATYEIYNKDEKTGEMLELISSANDIKEIPIGDGINYFYVKVTSIFVDPHYNSELGGDPHYTQVYDLVVYNDVKSTDNVITGITGMQGIPIDSNNVIRIDVSSTLTAVNAHFETNAFADVVVYADEARTFKLTPAFTYITVNNREVQKRTFRLGLTSRVAYYYVDVTSEDGKLNQYKVIMTKGATPIEFTDIAGHWAESLIKEVARLGIINGYQNADTFEYTFAPDRYASRQEMSVILCRMMGIDQLSFKDKILSGIFKDADSIAEWSYNYTKATYFLGIMVGSKDDNGDLKFNPSNNITRQEFFQAVSNMLKFDMAAAESYDLSRFKDASDISNWALNATKAVVKAGIVDGSDGYLNPKKNITRAEIAKIASIINIISADAK